MATYYIEVDTYWQKSKSYFIGPFNSRAQAETWYQSDDWSPDTNLWLATSSCGGDIRTAWRAYPRALSKTQATARGMRARNTLPPSTHPTALDVGDAVSQVRATYAQV